MKIIRHLTPAGPAYAALQPDGSAHEIAGDIFGDFRVTDRAITPGKLLAPVVPSNLPCIGLNYKKHAAESNSPLPKYPVLFIKNTASVQNPGDPIELPVKLPSTKVDYECELAVVIGKRCKNVSRADALDYVLGYTCANDVSARDWQTHSPTFTMGKSFDTHGPVGPWIVTADEIADPHALKLRCLVNGEVRQESDTGQMVHNIWQQIAYLSTAFTLDSGDLLATGTPSGVGIAMQPQQFLKPGDVVRCEIDGIGAIENKVVEAVK